MIIYLTVLLSILQFQNSALTMQSVSEMLQKKHGHAPEKSFLIVSIEKQEMYLAKNGRVEKTYRVSTSKFGIGNKQGSGKTPLGVHRVAEKFGDGAKPGSIFVGRKNTGNTAAIIKEPVDVPEDHVTTRILWLEGLEAGVNKGKGIDSKERYIYIHGTPEEGLIGTPASHGCVRMYNADVIELYELVEKGTLVVIAEKINL